MEPSSSVVPHQILAYAVEGDEIVPFSLIAGGERPDDLIWIDMIAPTEEERGLVEGWCGVRIPALDSVKAVAASQRFKRRGSTITLTVPLPVEDRQGHLPLVSVIFVLTPDLLITVRRGEADVFAQFASLLRDKPLDDIPTPEDTLLGLLEAAIGHVADVMQATARELAPMSRRVFSTPGGAVGDGRTADLNLQAVLRQLGRIGDRASVALFGVGLLDPLPEFLSDLSRHPFTDEQRRRILLLDKDLAGLERTAAHTSDRVQILLDATLGMITLRQTAINKVLSVVATVALPPTLIGTIYGMNFHDMPELDWPFGYPLALLAMLVSGVVPYLFMKRRGWL